MQMSSALNPDWYNAEQDGELASTVLKVPPRTFMFNAQTGQDNEFQHDPETGLEQLRGQALNEFFSMSERSQSYRIEVQVFDAHGPDEILPDAVFPNNCLVTTAKGEVQVFPLLTQNRKNEVKTSALKAFLQTKGKQVSALQDFTGSQPNRALEGKGVMVFDHQHNRIFAALSDRCDELLLNRFAQQVKNRVGLAI